MVKILIEGMDRSGKSTLIKRFKSTIKVMKCISFHTNSDYNLKPKNTIKYLNDLLKAHEDMQTKMDKYQPDIVLYDRGLFSDSFYWLYRNSNKYDSKNNIYFRKVYPKILDFYKDIDIIVVINPFQRIEDYTHYSIIKNKESLSCKGLNRYYSEKPFLGKIKDGSLCNMLRMHKKINQDFVDFSKFYEHAKFAVKLPCFIDEQNIDDIMVMLVSHIVKVMRLKCSSNKVSMIPFSN